jgi:hypothetical protein
MYLNIILTILVLVLILISSGVYFWWKKYGKKMFELMDIIKKPKVNPSMFTDIGDLLAKQNEMFKTLRYTKNKK